MAQFARPDADLHDGAWLNELGAADLFGSIDEASASDADYIESETAPAASPAVVSLSAIEDPLSSSGHVVRFRYQKSAAGGAQVDLTVELREGYVSEASQGTLIADSALTDIPNGWTNGTIPLSGPEADAITDYADLSLRFVANQV